MAKLEKFFNGHTSLLGMKVKDRISGFEGVACGLSCYVNGQNHPGESARGH